MSFGLMKGIAGMRGLRPVVSIPAVLWGGLVSILCLTLTSCAWLGSFAEKRADKAAYKIIASKQTDVLGGASLFDISDTGETTASLLLDHAAALADENSTTGAEYILTLADALAIAVSNNRDYKGERESLYQQALSLTETRRDFNPLFDMSGDFTRTRDEQEVEQVAPPTFPGGESEVNEVRVVERIGSRGLTASVTKTLWTGARVSMNFAHSFTHSFTSDVSDQATNRFNLSLVQPLLRGAGPLVARESLRQAERDMIYAVRQFRRYQQGFIIDAANRYFNLLSNQDQVRNAERNYRNTVNTHYQLTQMLKRKDGSVLAVNQAKQSMLQSEANLSTVRKNYQAQLDTFKIFLGIPIDLDIAPDPDELSTVAARGLVLPDMTMAEAVRIALERRLDLLTLADNLEDAKRGSEIALRNILPTLDVEYNYSTWRDDDRARYKLDFKDNTTREAAIRWNLPFDWTPRRNDYRRSQILMDRAERTVEAFRDQLALEVREAWRGLEESRQNYRIQIESVSLATTQVELARINVERGLAVARDLIEAQEDLLDAENALTNALVQNTIQRMEFWNAIERLEIDPQGLTDIADVGAEASKIYNGDMPPDADETAMDTNESPIVLDVADGREE